MTDQYSQRAARGQAYNLAVLTAIADGRHHDKEYVIKQFLAHLEFASILQECAVDQLAKVLDCQALLDKLKEIQTISSGL